MKIERNEDRSTRDPMARALVEGQAEVDYRVETDEDGVAQRCVVEVWRVGENNQRRLVGSPGWIRIEGPDDLKPAIERASRCREDLLSLVKAHTAGMVRERMLRQIEAGEFPFPHGQTPS